MTNPEFLERHLRFQTEPPIWTRSERRTAEKPQSEEATYDDQENSRFEIVVKNFVLDDDAVQPLPVSLPTPALLAAGRI